MSSFVLTPEINYLNMLYRNNLTQRWTIPIFQFDIGRPLFVRDAYGNDPLNHDPKYIKRVIDYFYFKVTEKWLYKASSYQTLLKYFRVDKNGDNARVQIITNIDDASSTNVDKADRKMVYRYIEKVFIKKKYIGKILKSFVKSNNTKWYYLVDNAATIKDLIAHMLKKLIVKTIQKMQDSTRSTNKQSRVSNFDYVVKRVENDQIADDDDDDYDAVW